MSIPRLLALVAVVLLGTGLALGAYLEASQPRATDSRPHAAPGTQTVGAAASRTSLPCTTGVRSIGPRSVSAPSVPLASAPAASSTPSAAIAAPAPRIVERVRTPARTSPLQAVTHAPASKGKSASASTSSWGVRSALEQVPSVHSAVTLEAPAPSWEPACAEPEGASSTEASDAVPTAAAPGPLGQTAGN